ncbi:hypothetical protein MicB006_4817 [Micromonospora sp. B006]|nr:hypothetical protein MicB006_4817 [Micromonospora sp. B006]
MLPGRSGRGACDALTGAPPSSGVDVVGQHAERDLDLDPVPVYGSLVTTEAIWTPGEQFRQRVDELARWLVTCCLLLDPQRIVLVGRVATEAQPAVV